MVSAVPARFDHQSLRERLDVRRRPPSHFACSAARALDVVGEWWTPLILRDIFLGVTRFDALQADLGIPRKALADRLARLVDHGVLVRVPYVDGRTRHAYALSASGRDFVTTLIALMNWGDRWAGEVAGPPLSITHRGCGGRVEAQLHCVKCRHEVGLDDVRARPGPGAAARKGTMVVGRPALDG